ncbi:amino acid ABC transporter permease [Mycolicibacterium mageritense]|uniref:Glutamine ABC transporter permease protein GlnP n=1 Tax=Mycolicibacterium mageritense TaxID=53462 RepID=A0AAI8TZF6_MYCME|nr:amino acid ABC transporter permease [Mycolicibacterium mageritense]TXI62772.1 MAG: amino acid ABC transporter permease [Mycolicibacterium mageritense]BDY31310.1 putative glutamine ABC transporter permease protein GlnP [Mycolicibacterium mageritense]
MNLGLIWQSLPFLWSGFVVTLALAAVSIGGSTLLGLAVAAVRTSRVPVLPALARIYVEIFRGSPIPITLLFVYFGAALYLGYSVNLFIAAAAGLSVYHSAFVAEIIRSGIEAVPVGQHEAAQILGLKPAQAFRWVVLPQTVKIVLPPMVGQYISLIKDTSIASIIGLAEMMKVGQSIVDRTSDPVSIYLTVAVLYFIVCYPLSVWVTRTQRKAI